MGRGNMIIGFGNYLKDYLELYNISQKEFALRLGITPKHLNEIINKNIDKILFPIKSIKISFNIMRKT